MTGRDPNFSTREEQNNNMYMILGIIVIAVIIIVALLALFGNPQPDASLVTPSPVDGIVATIDNELEPTTQDEMEATLADDVETETAPDEDDLEMTMTPTEVTASG